MYVGGGGIWEMSIFSPQLCCESKTAIKNSLFFEKGKICILSLGCLLQPHPLSFFSPIANSLSCPRNKVMLCFVSL